MASWCGNTVFTLLDIVLVLSFLMISVTESALFALCADFLQRGYTSLGCHDDVFVDVQLDLDNNSKTLTCKSLYGAQQGETCFNIIQKLKLDKDVFTIINPNLNCSAIFIGQWLCVDGKVVNSSPAAS